MSSTIASRTGKEIIASILEACNGTSNKTQIMFSTYLPFERASEYLDELTVKGFLAYDPYKRTYNLTETSRKTIQGDLIFIHQGCDQTGNLCHQIDRHCQEATGYIHSMIICSNSHLSIKLPSDQSKKKLLTEEGLQKEGGFSSRSKY